MERLERIEWKLDQIMVALTINPKEKSEREEPVSVFPKLTTKQHVALQMLLLGANNTQIGKRLGVTHSTAKVHVRGIAKKLGVTTRAQVCMAMMNVFRDVDDNAYRVMSGGLPKDWAVDWAEPDPFEILYKYQGGNDVEIGTEK